MDKLIPVLEETNRLLSQHFQNNTSEWVSIVISLVALFCAFYVPNRIANRQDKISLFEKRFAAYSDLLKLKNFAAIIKDKQYSFGSEDLVGNKTDPIDIFHETLNRAALVKLHFGSIFNFLPDQSGAAKTVQGTIAAIKCIEISVNMLPLLYSNQLPNKGRDASKEITDIFESLYAFMTEITAQNDLADDTHRTDFIKKTDAFIARYEDIFESGMQL